MSVFLFSVPTESKVRGALAESLSGSYLGQLTPGKKPEIFGPGIVSTFMREGNLVVTPDGKEIFFSVYTESEGTNECSGGRL